MISEDKKYISGLFRTFGIALLAPIGSIAFQYLVFNKNFLSGKTLLCLLAALLGWLSLFLGYNFIKEKKHD